MGVLSTLQSILSAVYITLQTNFNTVDKKCQVIYDIINNFFKIFMRVYSKIITAILFIEYGKEIRTRFAHEKRGILAVFFSVQSANFAARIFMYKKIKRPPKGNRLILELLAGLEPATFCLPQKCFHFWGPRHFNQQVLKRNKTATQRQPSYPGATGRT